MKNHRKISRGGNYPGGEGHMFLRRSIVQIFCASQNTDVKIERTVCLLFMWTFYFILVQSLVEKGLWEEGLFNISFYGLVLLQLDSNPEPLSS